DGLERGPQAPIRDRAIQTGHGANMDVLERRHDGSQIRGRNRDVAVADHEDPVLRLPRESAQLVDLAAGADFRHADDEPNGPFRVRLGELTDEGNCRVGGVGNGKQNFILRVLLPAETREMLARVPVEAAYRLEKADRRGKI